MYTSKCIHQNVTNKNVTHQNVTNKNVTHQNVDTKICPLTPTLPDLSNIKCTTWLSPIPCDGCKKSTFCHSTICISTFDRSTTNPSTDQILIGEDNILKNKPTYLVETNKP
jgi:hypothetical protein